MDTPASRSPLTRRQLVDAYFIENRTRLLEVAAFLDRLDRADDPELARDFRMDALHEALDVLRGEWPNRVKTMQMVFSDPTTEPLEALDRKSAQGAFDKSKLEAR